MVGIILNYLIRSEKNFTRLEIFYNEFKKKKTIRYIRYLNVKKNINISSDAVFGDSFNLNIADKIANLAISSGFISRNNFSILMYEEASLSIDKNVFFNSSCSVNCLERISIGENTIFGEGVKIYDHNHAYSIDSNTLIVQRDAFKTAPVSIGKNCWIGSNVTILKGVTIGDNVIVGANCLIHKSLPSNTIVKHKEDLLIENYKNY